MALHILVLVLALQDRTVVPDSAAQKEAEILLREVFKEEYAKKTAADKAALADRMVLQSRETRDDSASRFVLLREAQELYSQAGDLERSLITIDELGKLYTIDAFVLKSAALTSATKIAKTSEDCVRLANAQLRFSEDAVQADQYDSADKAVQAAGTAARRANSSHLIVRTIAKAKDVADLRSRFERLKKARETLVTSPEDAPSNLALGHFQAAIKGNWEAGLPLLAKGSDGALKLAAEKDLGVPTEASDQAAIGDAWWDLAEKETAAVRENLRSRALFWYGLAEEKLTGLVRAKISKRILDTRMEKINRGVWVDVSDPKLYGKGLSPLDVSSKRTPLERFPSGTYDGLTVRAKAESGDATFGVQYEPERYDMEINTLTGRFSACHLEGTQWKGDVIAMCPKKDEYILTLLIGEGEHVFYVDGREVGRMKSINEKIPGLQFYGFVGNTQFDQIKLRKKE